MMYQMSRVSKVEIATDIVEDVRNVVATRRKVHKTKQNWDMVVEWGMGDGSFLLSANVNSVNDEIELE